MKYETIFKVMSLNPDDFNTWEEYELAVETNTQSITTSVSDKYKTRFVEAEYEGKKSIIETEFAYEPINIKNGVDLIEFENGNLGFVNEFGTTLEILREVKEDEVWQ